MRRLPALAAAPILAALCLPAATAQAATPLCFGVPATIVGTAGPDTLTGTDTVSDVIYGAGGNDVIRGSDDYYDPGTAPDLLCGGPGNDYMLGSPGPDKLNGGDGNDYVNGNLGADIMQGNAGDDRILDESLQDMDSANDILRGGPGNDQLSNARGIDKVYGDGGNDTFFDASCSTTYLYGGAGADTFDSWRDDLNGTTCQPGDQRDIINGNDGRDQAKASMGDRLTSVEIVERVPDTW